MSYIVPKNKGGLGTSSLTDCLAELDTLYTIVQPIEDTFIENLTVTNTIQDGSYITAADVTIEDGVVGIIINTPTNDAFGQPIKLLSKDSRVVRTDIYKVKLNGAGYIESKESASKLNYTPMGKVKPLAETSYFLPVYGVNENELREMLQNVITIGLKVLPQVIIERMY